MMPEDKEFTQEEKDKKDERIQWCLDWIKRIKKQNDDAEPDKLDAERFYRADADIVKTIKGRSEAVTTDLRDSILRGKADFLEVFTSGDDIAVLTPTGPEDVEAVKNQELLINIQLKQKNKWFLICDRIFDDATKFRTGTIKYQWVKETKRIEKRYNDLTDDEYFERINQKNVEVISHEENIVTEGITDPYTGMVIQPAITSHNLTLNYVIEDEYPQLDAIPYEDFGYPKEYGDSAKLPFCYHHVRMQKYEFIPKFGKAKAEEVEGAMEEFKREDEKGLRNERLTGLGGSNFIFDKDSNDYHYYECFYYDPEDGDARIIGLCGDIEVFKDKKNEYGKPTFHCLTPLNKGHTIEGLSWFDILKEIQRVRTAMLREFLNHMYSVNNPRYIYNLDQADTETLNAFLNNKAIGGAIPVHGDPTTAFSPEMKSPMPPEMFGFWELYNTEKDAQSPTPRVYQGQTVPGNQQRTWRGQSNMMQRASRLIDLAIRTATETFFIPLISDLIDLNIRYMTKKTSVRYLNEWKEISPDNIIGKYDISANIGLGTGNRDQIILYKQQLLQLQFQCAKAGIPIVSPADFHYTMKSLIKAMGDKDVENFISDPQEGEAIKMLIQIASLNPDPQVKQILPQIIQKLSINPELIELPANAGGEGGGEQPPQASQPMQPPATQGGGYFG